MFINLKYIKRYIYNPHEIFSNLNMWKNPKISNGKFLFIVGAPRSGTTLLQRLIITNPNIDGFNNETSILSPKSIYDYNRFKDLLNIDAFQRHIKKSTCIVSFFENMHEEFINDKNKYILEKTPQHIKKIKFILRLFPKSKVIHIYRDGRDCYISGKNAKNIPQSLNLKTYAKYWKKCIKNRLEVKSKKIFDTSYETLVSDPKTILTEIFKFLNVEFSDNQMNMRNYSHDKRAQTEAFKRLNDKIDSSSVNQHLKYMSKEEIQEFNDICSDQLIKLGYNL